jgi:hypothetical protein
MGLVALHSDYDGSIWSHSRIGNSFEAEDQDNDCTASSQGRLHKFWYDGCIGPR